MSVLHLRLRQRAVLREVLLLLTIRTSWIDEGRPQWRPFSQGATPGEPRLIDAELVQNAN